MTDADRTDKAEERENMYIMMFTLQSLQNYGLSVKKTVERSLDYLWEWYQESGEERYLLLAKQHMQAYVNMGFALNEQNQTIPHLRQLNKNKVAESLDFTGVMPLFMFKRMLYGNTTLKFF